MKTQNQFPQKTEGHHCQGAGELPEPVLARDAEAMRSLARGVFEISFEIFNIRVRQQKDQTNARTQRTHTDMHARICPHARVRISSFCCVPNQPQQTTLILIGCSTGLFSGRLSDVLIQQNAK